MTDKNSRRVRAPGTAEPCLPKPRNSLAIRIANDAFRQTFVGGRVVVTAGIAALEPEVIAEIVRKVQSFNEFHPEQNDPMGEHDFGAFKARSDTLHIFWKIDSYSKDMQLGSPDPADPAKTTRVITILLASEY